MNYSLIETEMKQRGLPFIIFKRSLGYVLQKILFDSTHYYHFTKQLWATCTVFNVLHGWSRGQKNEQQNNAPNPKKQCSCRLLGSSENRSFESCRSTEQLNSSRSKIWVIRFRYHLGVDVMAFFTRSLLVTVT